MAPLTPTQVRPRRTATALSLTLVAAGLLASVASTDEDEPTRVDDEAAAGTDAAAGSDNGDSRDNGDGAAEVFVVGDTVELGDWHVVVHGVTDPYESGNEFVTPSEGNRFVSVDVEVTNNSDSPETVSSLLCFEIQDDRNISYEQALAGDVESTPDGEVAAGGSRRGSIVYEVPADGGGLVLNFACDLFSTGTATIQL